MLYGNLDGRGVLGRIDICVWLSPFAVLLKWSQHCLLIGYVCESLSHVWLFATPWAIACQMFPSMEFSRQEYWSGLIIMNWSRGYHALITWLIIHCSRAGHAQITWLIMNWSRGYNSILIFQSVRMYTKHLHK